ncbi:TRAP transporter substrate-binding protein [Desulfofundulus thermocisternus]|uniref:TRAP transporter substrate-binding protein n=1 Tax=Desulfofundulus thermocisternus TaxID=42471 RepID=UPI00217D350C|nr:TRAP transporter substrate-binding protein [Desulfofundulus thermocisternus]MCS5695042.1 TRAP transporter substrate-binding protein [Desulfofundulus thermocisternus]
MGAVNIRIKKDRLHKPLVLMLMLIFSLIILGGCAGGKKAGSKNEKVAAQRPQIEMRLAHVVQPTHPMHLAADRFARLVEEKSQGRIKITIYPARQLGDDRELFEQLQGGALDMAEISAAPLAGWTPIVTALQMPFLIESYDEWKKVMTSEAARQLLDGLSEIKVKGLAIYDAGFRHFVTLDKPVTRPQDLAGKKIRVAQSPLHIDIFKALGAAPTPLPYGEIYSALQNRVIDGLEMDLSAILMEKHYEVARYVTLSRHFTWPAILLMSEKRWKSLSDEDRKIIQEAAREAVDYNLQQIKELDARCANELRARGVTITELPNKDLFQKTTATVYQKYENAHPLVKQFVEYVESQKKKGS